MVGRVTNPCTNKRKHKHSVEPSGNDTYGANTVRAVYSGRTSLRWLKLAKP